MSESALPNFKAERKRFAELVKTGFEKLAIGDYEGALLEFDSAVLLDPDNGFANLLAAACLISLNRTDEAAAELANAGSPAHETAVHILRAQILSAQEHYDEAEHELWQAVAINPNGELARMELGRFLFDRNRINEACQQFERAVEINSASAEAHFLLGVSQIGSQEFDNATRSLERAVELQPLDDRALALYGHLLVIRAFMLLQTPAKLVGYNKAIETLKRAVEMNPSNEFAIEQLNEAQALVTRINTPSPPPNGFDAWREPFRWLAFWAAMTTLLIGYLALLVWLDESFGTEGFWGGLIAGSVFYLMAFGLALYLTKDYSALPPSIVRIAERFSRQDDGNDNEKTQKETSE